VPKPGVILMALLTIGRGCVPGLAVGQTSSQVGHLLLGANSHAVSGMMRAHWTGRDFEDAHRGAIWFTRQQESRMRVGIWNEAMLAR
jgi:hypothetical protein